jgi:hypothetical protein
MSTKNAVRQYARSQAAPAFQPAFGSRVAKGVVHPVTRTTFLDAGEAHTLDLKFLADELCEVSAAHENIPARGRGVRLRQVQLPLHRAEHVLRKKGDLPFVIFFETEIAIAANASPRDTFNLVRFDRSVIARWTAMVPDKIVAWRCEQTTNADHTGASDCATI